MSLKGRQVAPFLLVLLPLTSCVSAAHHVRYLAELEPPAQYNHPYDGRVDERVMPLAEVTALCASMGASGGAACAWLSGDGTCNIVLPNDYQAPPIVMVGRQITPTMTPPHRRIPLGKPIPS